MFVRLGRSKAAPVRRLAALPAWARLSAAVALGVALLPWALRAYAWWWGVAWVGACAAVETFLPRVAP